MIKIYPSSYAPAVGGTTNARYKEGCPRHFFATQALPSPEPRAEIDPLYSSIGRLVEEMVCQKLKTLNMQREVPIRHEIDHNIFIAGRIDFKGRDCIYEVKSTLSRFVHEQTIKRGVIDDRHLGQLVTYMYLSRINHGMLYVAYVHFDKAITKLHFEPRLFKVEIRNNTDIFLDGKLYHVSVVDILRFYKLMAEAVLSPALPPMTSNTNACRTCPFDAVCKNNPKDKSEFIRLASQLKAEGGVESSSPSIECHDIRKKENTHGNKRDK